MLDRGHRDNCSCACSFGGCSLATIFLRRADSQDYLRKVPRNLLFNYLMEVIEQIYPEHDEPKYMEAKYRLYRDSARLEVFERLQLPHVCCHFGTDGIGFRDGNEAADLVTENMASLDQLDNLMMEYDEALASSRGSIEEFYSGWIQGLPPFCVEEYEKLTYTQRRIVKTWGHHRHGNPRSRKRKLDGI